MHESDTLLLATVLFRHGDRTPDVQNTTPSNPYKNFSFYPYKLGELTHKGQSRMIKIGNELRERYKHFLAGEFYTDMVTSTTSSYTRCQMSLQCVHAGLFPPSQSHLEDLEIPWQAIPFDIIPFEADKFISIHMHCPQIMQNIDPNDIPPEDYLPLKYISEQAGYDSVEYINAMRAYDFYRTCVEAGLELPEWIRPLWPEEVRTLAYQFWYHFKNKRKRVGAVPLLKRITDEAKEKVTEGDVPYPKKLYLYACHDMNLHLLRGAMQIWTDEVIAYGAYLIVELHKINEDYGFKIFFQNGYAKPKLMTIPGYQDFITIRDFEKVTDLADIEDILQELEF